MKQIIFLSAGLFSLFAVFAQDNISIIPQPVKLTENQGHFILPATISINADENPGLKTAIAELTERLTFPTGYHVNNDQFRFSCFPHQPE